MAICGCCGSVMCGNCDPTKPLPQVLRVDIGGPFGDPWACQFGINPNRCPYSVGGLYNLIHAAPPFNQVCVWSYRQKICTFNGIDGYFTITFNLGQGDTPAQFGTSPVLFFQTEYSGSFHTSYYYKDLASPPGIHGTRHPAPNCFDALNAGLVMTAVNPPMGIPRPQPPPPPKPYCFGWTGTQQVPYNLTNPLTVYF